MTESEIDSIQDTGRDDVELIVTIRLDEFDSLCLTARASASERARADKAEGERDSAREQAYVEVRRVQEQCDARDVELQRLNQKSKDYRKGYDEFPMLRADLRETNARLEITNTNLNKAERDRDFFAKQVQELIQATGAQSDTRGAYPAALDRIKTLRDLANRLQISRDFLTIETRQHECTLERVLRLESDLRIADLNVIEWKQKYESLRANMVEIDELAKIR